MEYDGVRIVKGPNHPNDCNHKQEEYICSFLSTHVHGQKVYRDIFDMYVYDSRYEGELALCLRNGACGEYASAGRITEFIALHHNSRCEYYRAAYNILKRIGHLHWELKK